MALSRNARRAIARKKRLDAVERNQKRTVAIMVDEGKQRNKRIIDANVKALRTGKFVDEGYGYSNTSSCYSLRNAMPRASGSNRRLFDTPNNRVKK